ncbi:small GTP-binding protein [Elsinoe ampelina]|uniref:Small GTP-binding protein n=1 Tax=Elsinoe ampelina TaxID=302913 RepID=A0A6A6FZ64_9PEZI|nr:small GTP-binding protein [Elsinoe ampelina]
MVPYLLCSSRPLVPGLPVLRVLGGKVMTFHPYLLPGHDPRTAFESPMRGPSGVLAFGLGSTIYALSTAPGRAGIAVIRISGPGARLVYHGLSPGKTVPKPRYAAIRTLYEPHVAPSQQTMLDSNALILFFPGPHSVTGEDVLELHVHGGPAIVKAVLSAIPKCSGKTGSIRYAEAGEFSRRAFFNDRMDLTQVEALGDSLSAVTEQQRRLSVRGTVSNLTRRYESWRQLLLSARGELEALIDFSEDQHFDESPAELIGNVAQQVLELQKTLEAHTRNAVRGELLRNGISISLLGAPNAGKSSLLNRIVGREAAIVSHEAGTTRDVVEVSVDIGGYLCRFGDTAGLRRALNLPTEDNGRHKSQDIGIVEQEGIRRAKARAAESDLVIVALSFEPDSSSPALKLDEEVLDTARTLVGQGHNILVVVNKIDQKPPDLPDSEITGGIQAAIPGLRSEDIHMLSCRPNTTLQPTTASPDAGIPSFLSGLVTTFHAMTRAVTASDTADTSDADTSIWQESLGATERQRLLLEECNEHLGLFLDIGRHAVSGSGHCNESRMRQDMEHIQGESDGELDFVLAAEHLRNAAGCLARITGKGEQGDVEEVLGVVFERFCVGK